MRTADFGDLNISCCTAESIEATGAKLSDVVCETIVILDEFARIANVDIVLMHNGITSGVHASPEHRHGEAVDFAPIPRHAGTVDIRHYVPMLYWVGYRGVGIYWNGTAYSIHADIGDAFRQWAWRKVKGNWVKGQLILDPACK